MRDYLAPVLAAIQTPPHMLSRYFENAKVAFKNLEGVISQAINDGYELSYKLKYQTGDRFEDPFEGIPSGMRQVVRSMLDKDYGYGGQAFSRKIHWIQEASKVENPIERELTSLVQTEHTWGDYKEFLTRYKEFTKDYHRFLTNLEEAVQYSPEDTQEIMGVHHELQTYKNSLDALYKYISLYIKFVPKVQAFLTRVKMHHDSMYSWSEKKTKNFPPHKPIEVLFHASVDVPAILAEGFKTREELGEDKAALGGGPSDVISFTADIEVAKAIVDGFRDMIKIAKGEMTFEDIQEIARGEGLDPDIFDQVKKDYARRERPPGFPDFKYTDDDWRTPKKLAFEAYRMVLLPYSEVRYNPVFFGVSYENFENLDAKKVGIIAAKVQMDLVKDFLRAMEEFRVPVPAILSVKRVLY